MSILCILSPRRWQHCWPKHVANHCVYKLILINLCVFVATATVRTVRVVNVSLQSILTTVLDRISWLASRSGRVLQKETNG